MTESAMSQSVNKLKELLFDSEAERLDDLARRIDALGAQNTQLRESIAQRRTIDDAANAEISKKLDTVFARAGNTDNFTRAISNVLDRAFEKAETERHDSLSGAIAPVIVKTVKAEIMNSRDQLVEALYPMTGQMVKAYVASAMKDLANQVNRRLESNAVMLRIKSLTTGRSMAELAIAGSQRLDVEELLLIRRGSGELVARWPEKPTNNQDHVMGGVLSAINSYATEALQANEANLRQIDLGQTQIYLRGSPIYLLAAKCSGTAGASIERVIDDEFLDTVKALQADGDINILAVQSLGGLGPRLEDRINGQYEAIDAPALGTSPIKLLAFLIGIPLAAWLAWTTYVTYETNRVRDVARTIIETTSEISGYPTTLSVTPRGRSIAVSGLAPSESARSALGRRLAAALPNTNIDNSIAVVPQGARDVTPEIERLRRELQLLDAEIPRRNGLRALRQSRSALTEAQRSLERLGAMSASVGSPVNTELSKQIGSALPAIAAAETSLTSAPPAGAEAGALASKLNAQGAALAKRLTDLTQRTQLIEMPGSDLVAPAVDAEAGPAYVNSAERLGLIAERVKTVAYALLQAEITRASIPKPAAPQIVTPAQSPRDRLAAFTRDNAIFFADETNFRDDAAATGKIDILATMIKEADAFVRVIGYTDERGSTARNSTLSQRRADKVRDALVERGVRVSSLVSIGRLSQLDISPTTGSSSNNRRVEFEIGFNGEDNR